jgi:putative sigma-54 modulation protein
MQTSVTFKNLVSSENLKSYAEEKLDRLDKYLYNPAEANVVLCVEKFRHIAEINIKGDKLNINSKEETSDMYSAIDMVMDKVEKQIKKSKQKNRQHRGGPKSKSEKMVEEEMLPSDNETLGKVIIENIEYKPMDIDEAIEQMELVDLNFIVFTNAKTNKINVLYRRKDQNLGLIQPGI